MTDVRAGFRLNRSALVVRPTFAEPASAGEGRPAAYSADPSSAALLSQGDAEPLRRVEEPPRLRRPDTMRVCPERVEGSHTPDPMKVPSSDRGAERDGRVARVVTRAGESVDVDQVILELE